MGQKTNIEWTEATWNPIRGCSRVSEGCRNCYAETVANRFSGPGQPYEGLIAKGGQWNGTVRVINERMEDPLRWTKPRHIFVNSTSDLFHENVSFDTIETVFAVMALAQHHTFQILTKRPERMLEWFGHEMRAGWVAAAAAQDLNRPFKRDGSDFPGWPLPNVWIGVSVEDQTTADSRVPLLLKTPAAVRWVSAEPLLGPVALQGLAPGETMEHDEYRQFLAFEGPKENPYRDNIGRINWVVAGGESGTGARPMHPNWPASLRDQCVAAGVPFLFKQWGEWAPETVCATERGADSALYVERDGSTRPARTGARGNACTVQRNGKKATGRSLYGGSWDGYPNMDQPKASVK